MKQFFFLEASKYYDVIIYYSADSMAIVLQTIKCQILKI